MSGGSGTPGGGGDGARRRKRLAVTPPLGRSVAARRSVADLGGGPPSRGADEAVASRPATRGVVAVTSSSGKSPLSTRRRRSGYALDLSDDGDKRPAPPVEAARIADASEGSVETGASKDTGGSFSELSRLRWASRWSTPASTSTVEWRARAPLWGYRRQTSARSCAGSCAGSCGGRCSDAGRTLRAAERWPAWDGTRQAMGSGGVTGRARGRRRRGLVLTNPALTRAAGGHTSAGVCAGLGVG